MIQAECQILGKEKVGKGVFLYTLHSPEIAKGAVPGQFVHMNCGDDKSFILRRPFSINQVEKDNFKLLFKVVGRATKAFSKYQVGDYLDVVGPIGNGFKLSDKAILVAGGMGIAPLFFLAEALKKQGSQVSLLFGAVEAEHLYRLDDLEDLGIEVKVATEDGSKGYKGQVTDLLKQELSTLNSRYSTLYGCGPESMLKVIASLGTKNIDCHLSLERFMACGVGVCLSCVCQAKTGFMRVCQEGPVFDAKELVW